MDKLEQIIKEAVDQCVSHYTVTDNGRDKPMWMTKSAMRTVRRKHSAWIRYLNTKEGEDYQTYIRSRNTAQHAIRRARRQFERKLAKECRTNNKCICNYIRNRTNTRGGIAQLFKEDGTLTQGDREAAEVLNQHFFKTFTKEDTTNIPHVTPKNLSTETLTIFEITEELVKKYLLQLKTVKSPDTDGINPRILKEMSEQLYVPLNIIFKLHYRDSGEMQLSARSTKNLKKETQQTTGQCPWHQSSARLWRE